jgi:hypothetical protein
LHAVHAERCAREGEWISGTPSMARSYQRTVRRVKAEFFCPHGAGVQERKPDAVLVILQHMACWHWVNRMAKEAGVPLIVFSPIGTSFTGHALGVSRQQSVYVVSSLLHERFWGKATRRGQAGPLRLRALPTEPYLCLPPGQQQCIGPTGGYGRGLRRRKNC